MFVFKPKNSRYYRGRYRLSNGPRWYEVALRVEQKELASANLQKLVREKEHELLGWIPAKPLRDAAQTSIGDHLAEYVADLEAQGASKKHVALSRNRTQRLCAECNWRLLRDITPDSFTRWRAKQNFAPKTCNAYLDHASAFLNWMEKASRIEKNPLANVTKVETRGRERRVRRALTIEQFNQLLEVSGKRILFYMLAAYTGLRRGEVKALLLSDLHLNEARPYVLARASTTKNKKLAPLPLLPVLVGLLKALHPKPGQADGKVFPHGVPSAKTMRGDLAKCGIPAVDENGRRVDIHALRKTFCTFLHIAGVPQRIAQELMRHSEPRLTATVYTDANLLPLHNEVQKLARSPLPQTVPQISVFSGVKVTESVQTPALAAASESPEASQLVPICPSAESGGGGGIRTHGTLRHA